MLNMFDVAELKVGDKVGFARFHHWGNTMLSGGISSIVKIHPRFGHITLDNGKMFDKRGIERNTAGSGCALYSTDYIQSSIAAERDRRKLNDTYRQLQTMIENKRTGGGTFLGLTVEEKDAMISLIKQM